MKSNFRTGIFAFAVLLAAGVPLAATADSGYQLSLHAPSMRAGQAVVLTARGVNPTNGYDIYFFSALAFDPKVVSTCPGGTNEAVALAEQTKSGAILARTLREKQDAAGRWSVVFGAKLNRPGRTLICGYTHDGLDAVLATASLSVNAVGSAKKTR